MSGIWPYIVVASGIAVLIFMTWLSFASERVFHRGLKRREPLDDETFYQSFYSFSNVPADIPRRLRPIYGKVFGIDPAKLRPEDRPPEMDDIDNVGLVREIEAEFDVTISDADAETIDGSFDSIVQYLTTRQVA